MTLSGGEMLTILSDFARRGADAEKLQGLYSQLRVLCNGDFTEEMAQKATGIILAKEKVERNLAEEVKEWVVLQKGYWNVSSCYNALQAVTKQDKIAIRVAIHRLEDKTIIEHIGVKAGEYRLVEKDYSEQRWWEASGEPFKLRFPLGIEDYCKVYPGNTVLIEGQKSQGKSSFAMEFARLNCELFPGKARYQNVEMSDDEIHERVEAYRIDIGKGEQWWRDHIEFIRRTENWWDLIDPVGLNVVDYVVEYEKAYLIAQYIWEIHKRLTTGLAVVVVQRDPFKPYGAGGYNTRNIPRLILSLRKHTLKLEDVKSYWKELDTNPTGLSVKYKKAHWWKFTKDGEWNRDEEDFKKGKKDKQWG
jgi:hypothetical protein